MFIVARSEHPACVFLSVCYSVHYGSEVPVRRLPEPFLVGWRWRYNRSNPPNSPVIRYSEGRDMPPYKSISRPRTPP